MKKKGFTLAEVLITMSIIGIVAALTMPTLTANTRKKETTARLKKFYSMMQQALISSELENGMMQDWRIGTGTNYESTKAFFDKYLGPYLKYTSVKQNPVSTTQTLVLLNDGSSFTIFRGSCWDIIYDVNGPNKKPNLEGADIFRFLICPEAGAAHCGDKERNFCTYHIGTYNTREKALAQCKVNKPFCSALLQHDDWEIKDDYPWPLGR